MNTPNKTPTNVHRCSGTVDFECQPLCEAMNTVPGIETLQGCCGHDEWPYHIWFEAESLEALPPLLYWFDSCHCGYPGWYVIALTDCACAPVRFMVEGQIGEEAYKQADAIAKLIEDDNGRLT